MAYHKKGSLTSKALTLCGISFLANVFLLFGPEPFGALRSSAYIAQLPWSLDEGCAEKLAYCICPRATICAKSIRDIAFLFNARSVYFSYPLYMILFLSKAHHVMDWLKKTVISVWLPLDDLHQMHNLAGKVAFCDTINHACWHLLRWGLNNDLSFIYNSVSGRTGMIALLLTPIISLPMIVPFLKKNISWEIRKGLHYLSIVWGLCVVFHAPDTFVGWFIGIPLLIYVCDWIYGMLWNTRSSADGEFRRLKSASALTFKNPQGFKCEYSSYVLIMVPWIDRCQWHAFSVFPHKSDPNRSCLCILKTGAENSWTRQLHKAVRSPTSRPFWIQGPYRSPFAGTLYFDNVVVVATGVGITPALSLLSQNTNTHRRLNIIWICRDLSLIAYLLGTVTLQERGFILIYYTGREDAKLNTDLPANVFIYKGRPNIQRIVKLVIISIETGKGLPETVVAEGKAVRDFSPLGQLQAALLAHISCVYSHHELFEICVEETKKIDENTNGYVEAKSGSDEALSFDGIVTALQMLCGDDYNVDKSLLWSFYERVAFMNDRITYVSFMAMMEYIFDSKEIESSSKNLSSSRLSFDTSNDASDTLSFKTESNDVEFRCNTPSIELVSLQQLEENSRSRQKNELETNRLSFHGRSIWRAAAQSKVLEQSIRMSTRKLFTAEKDEESSLSLDINHNNTVVDETMKPWAVMYCGGNKYIEDDLREMSKKSGMHFGVERFDW